MKLKTAQEIIRTAKEALDQAIFTRKCVFCGETLVEKSLQQIYNNTPVDGICQACRKNLNRQYLRQPTCMKCGRQLDDIEIEYCNDCQNTHHFYDQGFAVYTYHDEITEAIYRFKYMNCKIYSEFFGNEMAKQYGQIIKNLDIDAIIPIPISRKRMKKRDYNQSHLLAKQLSLHLGIPEDENCIIREKNTLPQKNLTKTQRRKNIQNSFKLLRNVVKYKKVILVDDIYTTGVTLDECARLLKKAGIEKVYFITLAIGQGI